MNLIKTLSLSTAFMALCTLPVFASDLTLVAQSNQTSFTNLVGVVQNTGGDTISGVVCSDATITTGNTTAKIKITNLAGSNEATVDPCGTCNDLLVQTSHPPKVTNTTVVLQQNQTQFTNGVLVVQNTGLNQVKNVVKGTATISTGKAKVTIKIKNLAGYNQALIY